MALLSTPEPDGSIASPGLERSEQASAREQQLDVLSKMALYATHA